MVVILYLFFITRNLMVNIVTLAVIAYDAQKICNEITLKKEISDFSC